MNPLFMLGLICPKCGRFDIATKYTAKERNEDEHLIHLCKKCSYDWTAPTLDSQEGE